MEEKTSGRIEHIFSWLNQINDPKIGDVLN